MSTRPTTRAPGPFRPNPRPFTRAPFAAPPPPPLLPWSVVARGVKAKKPLPAGPPKAAVTQPKGTAPSLPHFAPSAEAVEHFQKHRAAPLAYSRPAVSKAVGAYRRSLHALGKPIAGPLPPATFQMVRNRALRDLADRFHHFIRSKAVAAATIKAQRSTAASIKKSFAEAAKKTVHPVSDGPPRTFASIGVAVSSPPPPTSDVPQVREVEVIRHVERVVKDPKLADEVRKLKETLAERDAKIDTLKSDARSQLARAKVKIDSLTPLESKVAELSALINDLRDELKSANKRATVSDLRVTATEKALSELRVSKSLEAPVPSLTPEWLYEYKKNFLVGHLTSGPDLPLNDAIVDALAGSDAAVSKLQTILSQRPQAVRDLQGLSLPFKGLPRSIADRLGIHPTKRNVVNDFINGKVESLPDELRAP